MKSVGVFLGISPSSGGMFQYAQSLLEALRQYAASGARVEIAYVEALWEPILAKYPYRASRVAAGQAGLRLSTLLLVARVPAWLCKKLSSLNPVTRVLRSLHCDMWIFPAQDALTYQIPFPAIGTVHDLMHRYESRFPEVSESGRFKIREHRFGNLVRHASAVLVDSQLGKEHVIESYGGDAEKIFVLPYIAPAYITLPEPTDFDQKYRLPSKFLFYPAQFWEHKNHRRLLDAAARVATRHADVHLVFAGGHGHQYEQVKAHAKTLGIAERVMFPGFVPDAYLSGFYRRARALVMPTFFGPTNIPPLEAFACGCPAAVSNIYAMPEQAKGAALLFDPLSSDDIERTIELLWADDQLCEQLRVAGLDHAKVWGQDQFAHVLIKNLDATRRDLLMLN
ncbi:glycosyltransferase family 1 protein [Herbaspirillum sp. VT-16-41]|uniref:glycosyltransferase family 4 protein n=1 Tax=Herbaspirillum sp. VT-16-41 TaxID=1953765 RepID=UPI000980C99F|nr:glycosyltransferase family 1 protein [Herbaspirillum sp. VT-16-41]